MADLCSILKIIFALFGAATLGYLGARIGNIIGAIVGLVGGFAVVFFWLNTIILFWC